MSRTLLAAASLVALASPVFADIRGSSCTTSDPYLPGGTTTMCWTCTSGGPASPSPECLGQVALGYPDGFVVGCDSQDALDSAGNPVDFSCAAAGQTVTYSDADGGEGEICPAQSWDFCVDVTAPVSADGLICAFYTLSGDGAGGGPHEIIDCGSCLPAAGSVTIVAQATSADVGGQLFGFAGDLGPLSLGAGQSTTVDALGAGTYTVGELVPAGWDLTGLTCDDPDGGSTVDLAAATAVVDLDPGEDITCVFHNTERGGVTVAVETVPAGAGGQSFAFAGDLGAFSLAHGESRTVSDLVPGVYGVSEIVPASWDLTGLTCTDPDDGSTVDLGGARATLDLDPGEQIACTFRNTARGTVTILKEIVPADGGGEVFDFAGGLGAFALAGGQSHLVVDLLPGVYDVVESPPEEWRLTGLSCVDPDGGSTVDLTGATATLDLDPGEDITCTFVNTQSDTEQGTVTVVNETAPADAGGQLFAYTGDLGAFSITGGQSRSTPGLAPGAYEITEILPAGWDLTGLSCVDPDGGSIVDLAAATAVVDLDDGEEVICTFVNTARGSATVVMETVPADAGGQLFDFDGDLGVFSLTGGQSRVVDDLLPGGYSVAETLPAGWELTGLSCADPDGGSSVDLDAAAVLLDVDPGEAVICTFVNTRQASPEGTVTIVKETLPAGVAGGTFGFTGDVGAFTLAGGQSTTVGALAPGSYRVSESVVAGWDLTQLSCDDPDGGTTVDLVAATVTIDLDADEEVTCTFVNSATATSLTIVKQTLPRDAGQTFDFTGDLGAFSLGSDGRVTFSDLDPGDYTVAEALGVAGWALVDISCDDLDGGTSVDLGAGAVTVDLDTGEQITCFFTNRADDYDPIPVPALSPGRLALLAALIALAGICAIRVRRVV